MLCYRTTPKSDPFYWIFSSDAWLHNYDPPREFPFWINLELTNKCQLDCLFCSRQLSTRPLGEASLQMVQKVVNEVAGQKEPCGLRLTGWGEPLLYSKIKEAVALIKEAGLPLKIYTNGLCLTPDLMEFFIKHQVDDLQFSLQGLTAEQYEFNRRKSSFEKLLQNIKMASELRGEKKRPFLSILTSVLADEAKSADPEKFCHDFLKLVDKVAVDLTNLNFVAETPRVKELLVRQSDGLERKKCVDIFLALEVKYDGLIQFCGQDANGLPEHSLGNISDMTLAAAWIDPKMEKHRNLVGRTLGHEKMAVCRNCFHNTKKYDVFNKQSV